MLGVDDLPAANVTIEVLTHRAVGAPRKGEASIANKQRIESLLLPSLADAPAVDLIRAKLHDEHASARADLARMGQTTALAELDEKIENARSTKGVRGLRWSLVTLPILRRLGGRLLEDLIAAGEVTAVEELAYAPIQ